MELTKKLVIILLSGPGAGFLAISTTAVWQTRSQSMATTVDSCGRQMDSIAYASSEIGIRDGFENLGNIAAGAYLKYQFRKCYKGGYTLLKGKECLVNLTDYETLSPSEFGEEHMIQHLGTRLVLLMKREISWFPGCQVLMTQDITPYYQEIERQGMHLLMLCGLIWAVTGAGVSVLVHRALKPLRRLTKAAEKIGEGNLDERVPVESRDEIGEFAQVLNQMTKKVEGQVGDLQLFLGALAYEIKIFMTAVIGYSDSLLHVKLFEESRKRTLEQTHHAGLRLERLSAKMLNSLGIYENDEAQFEELGVEAPFQEVIGETEPLWSRKGVVVEAETGDGAPESVNGDRELLLTLLNNLVHNRIKASAPGNRIRLRADQGVLSVRDEGCGIPEKDLPHVKETFYMANKSRSRSGGGSGLGLALYERIARLHGMEMKIESMSEGDGKGKDWSGGTVVFLYLPDGYGR